jgi:hypothetical protein
LSERCSAAGFQHLTGDYLLFPDRDMVRNPAFLASVALVKTNWQIADVGARIVECNTQNEQFQMRATQRLGRGGKQPGIVDRNDLPRLYHSKSALVWCCRPALVHRPCFHAIAPQ